MIEELLAVLTAAGLEPEPRELRDALWLAGHIVIIERADEAVPPPDDPGQTSEPAPPPPIVDGSTPVGEPAPPADATMGAQLYAGGGSNGGLRAMEARSPAVPALRRQMQLARALRPFRRRVPSRTSSMVDEDATATGVAEEGMWLPVLRPASARWLDLALVVDTAPSMVVWRRTVAELRTLAERLGAFRTVRVFAIDSSTDASMPITIRPESLLGGPAGLGREPATLIDPTHRQAILVVTDAIGAAWRDGRMDALLRRWGATAPLAVATVLPQRMWSGTGLRAVPAQLHALTPGLANETLVSRGGRSATPGPVPIPVMELSARWLAQWAQLVAGAPGWRNAALLATPSSTKAPAPTSLAGGSAAEVVRRFRAAASPTAFQLACYLSAAWLNLPVMRLVQRVMLPESDTVHLAEVFLGGLLRAISTEDRTADPEAVQYDFLPGVRDELNSFLLRNEMLDVLRETSQFVAERFGQPLDFAALLADPEGSPLPALGSDGGPPLAYVAATVLAKLGGRYRALADRLATVADPAAPGGLTHPSADAYALDSLVTPVAEPRTAGTDLEEADTGEAASANTSGPPTGRGVSTWAPSIFVCYRRTDEPYAAALTASLLEELLGEGEVFLDTLYLRQRGPFERDLLAAVRNCRLVLAVIGSGWDSPANLARFGKPTDWVRRELLEASAAGTPIVPVLVGRSDIPAPAGLTLRFDERILKVDPDDPERLDSDFRLLLDLGEAGSSPPDRRGRVERAALALLRHVLPQPQLSMDNERTIARSVASELGSRDWLRFVTTGSLPRKPNGSAVVYLTRTVIGIAQLTEDLGSHGVIRFPLRGLLVEPSSSRRLWRRMTNLALTSNERSARVEGIFEEEADELLELLGRPLR